MKRKIGSFFGMIGAAFGLGFILGPAVGGLLGVIDPRLPFWGAAATSLVNACYGFFVLPESLPHEKRMSFAWKRANPVGSLKLLRSHRELLSLAAVVFLGFLGHAVLPSGAVLYVGYRYEWDTKAVGFMLAGAGVSAMIVQGLLMRPLTARFGERKTLLAGLLSGALGFAVYGMATDGWIYCAGIPIMAFWGLAGPSAQSFMSCRPSRASSKGPLRGSPASPVSLDRASSHKPLRSLSAHKPVGISPARRFFWRPYYCLWGWRLPDERRGCPLSLQRSRNARPQKGRIGNGQTISLARRSCTARMCYLDARSEGQSGTPLGEEV